MRYYISGGFVWALTCLFRPTIALYPIVIFIMWIIFKYSIREMFKYTVVVSCIFCILLSPWWIRNYLDFNLFIPLTHSSGNPFLQGTYINYDQTKDFTHYSSQSDAIKTDDLETQVAKYRLETYFKKYPLQYVNWYTVGKTWHLWRYPFYWKHIFNLPFEIVQRYHRFILYFGLIGMAFSMRNKKKRKMSALLLLIVLYFTLSHLPYYTFSRYAYPAMPAMIIFMSYSVYTIFGFTKAYAVQLYRRVQQQAFTD